MITERLIIVTNTSTLITIARKLVAAMLDGMKKEGISKVALVVFAKNDAVNAFYEKIGWNKRDDLIYRNIALVNLERIDT